MQLGRLPLCQLSYSRAFRAYQIVLRGLGRRIGESHTKRCWLSFVDIGACTHERPAAAPLTLNGAAIRRNRMIESASHV